MPKQQHVISWTFITIAAFTGLMSFPMLISGGPGQEDKLPFLLNFTGLGVGCGICGIVLLTEKREWNWLPVVLNFLMILGLGLHVFKIMQGPDGIEWLQRNNLVPLVLIFMIYAECYLIPQQPKP